MNMNAANTPTTSVNTKITTIVSQINQTCDELVMFLDMTPSSASSYYGITQVNKMDSEYIDVMVNRLLSLKTYLNELQQYTMTSELSQKELTTIYNNCGLVVAKIFALAQTDAYYSSLLEVPCMEIAQLVDEIKKSVKSSVS